MRRSAPNSDQRHEACGSAGWPVTAGLAMLNGVAAPTIQSAPLRDYQGRRDAEAVRRPSSMCRARSCCRPRARSRGDRPARTTRSAWWAPGRVGAVGIHDPDASATCVVQRGVRDLRPIRGGDRAAFVEFRRGRQSVSLSRLRSCDRGRSRTTCRQGRGLDPRRKEWFRQEPSRDSHSRSCRLSAGRITAVGIRDDDLVAIVEPPAERELRPVRRPSGSLVHRAARVDDWDSLEPLRLAV